MISKFFVIKRTGLALCAFSLACSLYAGNSNIIWSDTPATYFEEAFPIGNGRIGAMVYGRTCTERLSLNDITLWTGEPEGKNGIENAAEKIEAVRTALRRGDYRAADSLQHFLQGHYCQNYQPVGDLFIRFNDCKEAQDYRRELNLSNAIATIHSGSRIQTVQASSPDSVIMVRLHDPEGIYATLWLESQQPVEKKAFGQELAMDGYVAYTSLPNYCAGKESFKFDPDRATHFRTLVHVVADNKDIKATGDSLILNGCTDATIYIANSTSFAGFDKDPVRQGNDYRAETARNINRAVASNPDAISARAAADHARFYNRVTLELGSTTDTAAMLPTEKQLLRYTDLQEHNPDLEELYFNFGRYLLISCSRTPGVPANLQGLWNESLTPPWSSNYTTNINLEENYWGAETTNLPEMHRVLIGYIDNLSKTGRETAKNYWNVDSGWCLGHNTDIWAMTCPVGLGGGAPQWANWNMGGTWLSTHIWEQYLFNRDIEALRASYPALSGAARFALGWLIDENGVLTTSPSTSPENNFIGPDGGHYDTSIGTTADMALIRECLLNTRAAALELDTDAALVAEIDRVLPLLRPYQIKEDGSLNEWSHNFPDVDPHHRHQSHLIGLYPGHHISLSETPELARACAKTLEIKGTETTGWSAGWRVNLLARLADADGSYRMLRRLLRYVSPDGYKGPDRRRGGGTYPNLFDAHSPYQIDGNFGGSAGMAEMLVQSSPSEITLLPALPSSWANGHAKGLRTRTGMEVAFAWSDGKATAVELYSPIYSKCTLNVNGKSIPVTVAAGERVIIEEL